jgi:hypothetical protein
VDSGTGESERQARHRSPEVAIKLAMLDTVVLKRDLPEHGLRSGDVGAVVELYGTDGVEVEFVWASGQTNALVTLKAKAVALAAHPALRRILEVLRLREGAWTIVTVFAGRDRVRAEPFDAVELDLGALWA